MGISEPGVCRPPPVLNVPGDLISPRHQEVPPLQGNKAQIHLSRIGHSDDTWCQLKRPSAQQPHWHPKTTRPMAHLSFAQPACRGPWGTADGAGPSGGHGPGGAAACGERCCRAGGPGPQGADRRQAQRVGELQGRGGLALATGISSCTREVSGWMGPPGGPASTGGSEQLAARGCGESGRSRAGWGQSPTCPGLGGGLVV